MSNELSKSQRIDELVERTRRDLNSGLKPSLDEICESHIELMPELRDELSRMVSIVQQIQKTLDRTGIERRSSTDNTSRELSIVCPFCLNRFVVQGASTDEILCESCGTDIQLIDSSTSKRSAGMKISHFTLEELIGGGSYGEVWKCWDDSLERRVAVKFPKSRNLSVEQQARFIAEGKAAAQVRHPNVVAIHEVGRDGEHLFIASEFVEGDTLEHRLERKAFTYREIVEFIFKVASGLRIAHDAGVVHRDLKPQNILITDSDEPRIVDFGLAKRDECDIVVTLDGQVMGTPAYMSPEQARGSGNEADARSDIFSVGSVLYEMLTGVRPFDGKQVINLISDVDHEPERPRRIVKHVPKDLETICLKCLEKRPEKRFQNAADLLTELQHYLDGKPLTIKPPSSIERAYRWCRRSPALAGVYALLALVVVILSVSYVQISRKSIEAAKNAETAIEREKEADQQRVIADEQRIIADKQRAIAEERLAEGSFASAEMASQRGRWREMLISVDQALKSGHDDEAKLLLMKVAALDGVGDHKKRNEIVEDLLAKNDLGDLRGEAVLWKATIEELEGRTESAQELLEQAVSMKLSPADLAFANALLTKTSAESVTFLQEAIEHDPYHQRANARLAIELFLSGNRDACRLHCHKMMAAYPDDPKYAFHIGLVDCVDGNLEAAINRIERYEQQISQDQMKRLIAAFRVLAAVSARVNFKGEVGLGPSVRSLITSVPPMLAMMTQRSPVSAELNARMPSRQKQMFIEALQSNWFTQSGRIKAFEKLSKAHPEGTIMTMYAGELFKAGRHEEAAEVAADAMNLPFLVPAARDLAMKVSVSAAFLHVDKVDEESEYHQLRDHVTREHIKPTLFYPQILGFYAARAGDFDLANEMFTHAIHMNPDEDFGHWSAYSALKSHDYARALRLIRRMKKTPNFAPPMTAEQIEQEAIRGMRELLSDPNSDTTNR
ncbi:MAG: protein kinase [Planctomycetales bacterium]|nr:protein kinase [Planctomycetales bacterium]